jgi:hypothetical protein
MTSNRYTAFEIRVPLQKKCVYSVHFRSYCVHNSLTVGGAVVEEDIQNSVVGEVSEAVDAGQGYPLQISEKRKGILSRKSTYIP